MENLTVKTLLDAIKNFNIPDDAEIWIEYPERYGVLQGGDAQKTFDSSSSPFDVTDMICSTTFSWNKAKNRLTILHHY